MKSTRPAIVSVLVAWLFVTSVATGQSGDVFEQGVQAYREGRYEQAIELFERANREKPHPALVYNIGQAHEKLGNVERAIAAFREYLRVSPDARDREEVERRIAALMERSAHTHQALQITSSPSGAHVHVDGKLVGRTPWSGELAAGEHSLELRLGGHRSSKRRIRIADRAVNVDVSLPPLASGSPEAPTGAVADHGSDGPLVRPWTWVALGVGVAGLGAAGAFELARRGAEDDAESASTQVAYVEEYDRMQQNQTLARVFAGVGGAALIAGGVLLTLDLTRDRSAERSGIAIRRISAGCSVGCGLELGASF